MTGTPTEASTECGHPAGALLDFHVNGSLEGEEAAMVAAHVAECAVCARDVHELRSLAAAIEAHGVAPASAWRGGSLWAWIGTAAAVLVVGIIVSRVVPSGPAEPRVAAASPERGAAGADVTLDLGVGGLRDGASGPPRADLAPGVPTLRLTLLPPVVPGVDLRLRVLGPGGEEIVAEQGLPGRDAMGRMAIVIPASAFTASGIHQVVLTSAAPDSGAGPFSYPFEVQVPADGP